VNTGAGRKVRRHCSARPPAARGPRQ